MKGSPTGLPFFIFGLEVANAGRFTALRTVDALVDVLREAKERMFAR